MLRRKSPSWRRALVTLGLAIGAATLVFTPAKSALAVATNLARFGTATATGADFGASIEDGIDGNRNGDFNAGSVFYANAIPESPPLFYEVDLGVNAYIDRVQMLRRTDADQGVFGNMRLTIYEDDGGGNPGVVSFTKDYLTGAFGSGGFEFGTWGTTDPGLNNPQGAFGRHVRLERIDNNYWLTFAEFEVIGSTSPLPFTEANNIAAGKPVTTSSPPGFNALITSGNDGNIDGNFGGAGYRPVYHSSLASVGEFWQVDLGAETQLDHLQFFSRTDEGRDINGNLYVTTAEFKVSVLNESLAEVGSFIVQNPAPSVASPVYDQIINTAGMIGRYVRIETTQDQLLAFAELRAFEGPGSIFAPGDFNQDNVVDGDDLAQWRIDFGVDGDSDADGDGDSDGNDFLIWQQQLGTGAAVVSAAAVPEPSVATLALCGAAALPSIAGRRRCGR